MSASPEPNEFTLAKDGGEQAQDTTQAPNEGGEQVSAADYDPNQDRREDEGKRIHDNDHSDDEVEMVIEEEDDEDDLDDMFAVATTEKKKVKKVKRVLVREHFGSIITLLTNCLSETHHSCSNHDHTGLCCGSRRVLLGDLG